MTFEPSHSTQFTDPVCAIMSVSSGKVLSHENEGSIVVFAFVTISPRLVLDMCICAFYADFCQLQGFLVLSHVHAQRPCPPRSCHPDSWEAQSKNARVTVCTARQAYCGCF